MADSLFERARKALDQLDPTTLKPNEVAPYAQAAATFALADRVDDLVSEIRGGFGEVAHPLNGIATAMNKPNR